MLPKISVRHLSKRYKLGNSTINTLKDSLEASFRRVIRKSTIKRSTEFWALRDVNFDVPPGEILGIIGPNGSGKSTLLKILSRITEPTGGNAIIRGSVLSLLEIGTGFHPDLTGRENVFLNGTMIGMRIREIQAKFDKIVAFAELEKFIDLPVKWYSTGMYVRLAFAVAAHLESEVLLIDEALAVGDAAFQKKCLEKSKDVATGGKTVVLVSHDMAVVTQLCQRVLFLSSGRIQAEGPPNEVLPLYQSQLNCHGTQSTITPHETLVFC